MEKHEFFHASLERERHGFIHAAVPPADVPPVFGAIILGIQNEHIGVADEINHFKIVAALARFNIGEKDDDAIGRKQPVADGDAGMIGALGADEDIADGKVEIHQFFNLDVAGQLGERHGKIGAFHLAGERGDEAGARAFATENPQPAAGFVKGRKKRQALDVIPMRVRNKQGEIERPALEFIEERSAKLAQAGAGIKDDDVRAAANLDAGGVAAVTHGARSRRGNRAAHAPKLDVRSEFDEKF